ncbi:MAG: Crp/Fnr family transcriptional regulator [Candidatus Alcyoniella australis]|nr:Crp/Fnr family transcriptional regulator [Candidatus Alcyoniella australis]
MPADKLGDLTSQSRVLSFRRNDVIYMEGSELISLYLIVSGRIKLIKYASNGSETILGVFHAVDTIGELSAIDARPSTHSAVAMEPTTVLQINMPLFRLLLRNNPGLSLELASEVGSRLRDFEDRITGLSTNRVDQRIATLLLKIANDQGGGRPLPEITLPYTRQEIADLVGTTVETCIRVLSAFERQGVIGKLSRTRLSIDANRLQAMANIN